MQIITDRPQALTAIRTDLGAISSRWNLSIDLADYIAVPGRRRKISKHAVRSGDVAGLWAAR